MSSSETKHILFHRSTPWHEAIECSTKIYAKKFSRRGYAVSYMQDLTNLLHRLTRRGYYQVWSMGTRWEGKIWVMAPFSLLPRLKVLRPIYDWVLRACYRLCLPSIKRQVLQGQGREPDVIWTTAPGSSSLKDLFPNAQLIFHVVDYYPAFRGDLIKKTEKIDYQRADHVFSIGSAVTKYLVEELEVPECKITTLGQGVDLNRYKGFPDSRELNLSVGITAVYVGVVKKLDQELLSAVACKLASYGGKVLIVGPEATWSEAFSSNHENVEFVGAKQPDEVVEYLRLADLGIMVYDREKQEVYRGQNPLKLYEYAAASLPVISTNHDEYEKLNPPIEVVDSITEVESAIDNIIANYEAMSRSMKAFASMRSWDHCADMAERVIDSKMGDKR